MIDLTATPVSSGQHPARAGTRPAGASTRARRPSTTSATRPRPSRARRGIRPTQAAGEPIPSRGGAAESFLVTGLETATEYFFALKAVDQASNWSALSNGASATDLGRHELDGRLGDAGGGRAGRALPVRGDLLGRRRRRSGLGRGHRERNASSDAVRLRRLSRGSAYTPRRCRSIAASTSTSSTSTTVTATRSRPSPRAGPLRRRTRSDGKSVGRAGA